MSLFSSFILPTLEKELVKYEPEVSQFLLAQLKQFSGEVLAWAELKLHTDLNNDGNIGAVKDEAG